MRGELERSHGGRALVGNDEQDHRATPLSGAQLIKNLLAEPEQRPTAVFAASDEMATGAILAARDLGLDVPRDLSAIGIDAHPIGGTFGLTTIDRRARRRGTHAAQLLLRQLVSRGTGHGDHELHRAHFIARSSTAPPGSNSSPA
ncbi:LacI family transcriptional regulator [Kocuria marina subsp. indica]|nr:hypothetical protein B1B07_10345 [Kocuria indica]RLP57065.1 LacI family transcriptional regulator [Kocuria indica]